MKYLLPACFLLFFFFKISLAFAGDVVLNEFQVEPDSDQWVEIYNKGSSAIDISGWIIDDNGGTQAFDIPPETTILPGEYKVFSSSYFNLNRTSADAVRFLHGATEEDKYEYATGPGANRTYGRNPDGNGAWVVYASYTKGWSNNGASVLPTSTPTPTLTPTIANSPTPTKSPTSTKTPTPTKIPTKAPSPTSSKSGATKAPTTKPQSPQVDVLAASDNRMNIALSPTKKIIHPTAILGAEREEKPTLVPTEEVIVKDATKNKLLLPMIISVILVVIGSTYGILTYFKRRKEGIVHEDV